MSLAVRSIGILVGTFALNRSVQAQGCLALLRQDLPVGGAARSVAAADLERDGVVDLTITHSSPTVLVLIGNGAGTFQQGASLVAGDQPADVVAADLDGDGDLDLAVANYGSGSGHVSLLWNNRNGIPDKCVNQVPGDCNQDGVLDIADGVCLLGNLFPGGPVALPVGWFPLTPPT